MLLLWFCLMMCVFFLGLSVMIGFYWWLEDLEVGGLLVDLFLLVGSYSFWNVGCCEIEDWLVVFCFCFCVYVLICGYCFFGVVVVNCVVCIGLGCVGCVWWLVVNWLVVYLICFEIWIKEFNMCVSYWVLWNLKV